MKRLLVVFALVGLAAVGCSSSDDSKTSTAAPPVSLPGTVNDHGTKPASNPTELELDDNYFAATFVKASAGQQFNVELRNEGTNTHTFTSAQLGVDQEVAPGTTKTVTVTAPPTGSAEFHCRFHQALGMQGAVFIG